MQPLPLSRIGVTLADIYRRLDALELNAGSEDIQIQQSPNGTTVSLTNQGQNYLLFQGDFDQYAAYAVNDIVRLTASIVINNGVSNYTCPAGSFVCVSPVPAKANPAYYSTDWQNIINTRIVGVNYCPMYPEPTLLVSQCTGSNAGLQGKLWSQLSSGGGNAASVWLS